jgi:hypothetical protein
MKESGRAFISKGFWNKQEAVANYNVSVFRLCFTRRLVIGIEPSAI